MAGEWASKARRGTELVNKNGLDFVGVNRALEPCDLCGRQETQNRRAVRVSPVGTAPGSDLYRYICSSCVRAIAEEDD